MTEAAISKLPKLLQAHLCTMKKASWDITNHEFMSESEIIVVNFDKIPQEYARGKGWPGIPKSNDELYIDISVS